MIRKYAELERHIEVDPQCKIGAGYTACQDTRFDAKNLIEVLLTEEIGRDLKAKVHLDMKTVSDLVETFLFHFSNGINGEFSATKEIFEKVLSILLDPKHAI